ncbi:RNA 2',3'-cyclic phosphodiesterase [Bacillus spongiae]|uniref:RNA 2',3'-cyclic phosphodiesterase n=1 Tax=Bacillus spongiae TaxID=2683610 RepID=A0ABU8HHG2_9BACI
MKAHFFLAVPLMKSVKKSLYEWTQSVEQRFPFQRWVHQEDYHLTLVFLGEVTSEQVMLLQEKLKLLPFSPFMITINRIGTFGKQENPRVFWAGIKESEELYRLREYVYKVCQEATFQLEKRPFSPHVTIARKWKGESNYLPLMEKDTLDNLNSSFIVKDIVLYQTHMDRLPKYEVIQNFPLMK